MKLKTEHEKLYDRQLRAWGHDTQEKIISTTCVFDVLDKISFEAIRNLTLLGFDTLVKQQKSIEPARFFGDNILKEFGEQIKWLDSLNELTKVDSFDDSFSKIQTEDKITFSTLEILKTENIMDVNTSLFVYTEKYKGYSFLFVFRKVLEIHNYSEFRGYILTLLEEYIELDDEIKNIIKELLGDGVNYESNILENRMFGSSISRRAVDFIINSDNDSLFVFNYENVNATDYKIKERDNKQTIK